MRRGLRPLRILEGVSDPVPDLSGTWHIVRTSLRLWRSRQDPTLSYLPLPDGTVLDATAYRTRRRSRVIVGLDRPDGDGGWVWRGLEPLTLLARSRWRVVASGQDWMVIHFSRTPFTAEGVDLCHRRPYPTGAELEGPLDRLAQEPRTAPFADRLFTPRRTADGVS